MINYKEIEDRIKNRIRNCSSEEELLRIEDEVSELVKKYPEIDSDGLYFPIADRRKYFQDHMCDLWKLRRKIES